MMSSFLGMNGTAVVGYACWGGSSWRRWRLETGFRVWLRRRRTGRAPRAHRGRGNAAFRARRVADCLCLSPSSGVQEVGRAVQTCRGGSARPGFASAPRAEPSFLDQLRAASRAGNPPSGAAGRRRSAAGAPVLWTHGAVDVVRSAARSSALARRRALRRSQPADSACSSYGDSLLKRPAPCIQYPWDRCCPSFKGRSFLRLSSLLYHKKVLRLRSDKDIVSLS